ncbi:MAG TPA: histone deacetylase [Planctomycetes bacterium]|nr:histone deacetylase [Planctomycetota bacterium]
MFKRWQWSEAYGFSWEGHVFPLGKYARLKDRLVAELGIPEDEIGRPEPLDRDTLLLGHTAEYLDRLEAMTAFPEQGWYEFEAPCSREVLDGFYAMAAGTVAAIGAGLESRGFAANLGGGFHHAFPWKGEGFCAINDIVVGLQAAHRDWGLGRAVVLDLDVHQGNGTAKALEDEEWAFTCSIHQQNNYPIKQRSDLDIGLEDRAGDEEYLAALDRALEVCRAQDPELLLYVAGADPYVEDRLGGLDLSIEGFAERDRRVFGAFLGEGVPVVAVLAGGYAEKEEDVVEIHFQMIQEGIRVENQAKANPKDCR